ncbi:hypothetical protein DUNSADRAFT_1358 [Dunaliella salina]|uniref:Uncharacterized protein n=1 Tax=Dunaliella salina TaxID=3046 RepID=A0ABQ7GX92_DUNSA|nr:hypothetical protein DUNSADRAFT_1358 [Dunaliella salina]|eukprot:KAF5839222.1 hypothetical protein DUNSADRAFT_1358 [Dunaliella salina]
MPGEKTTALLSALLKAASGSISVAERPWHLLSLFKAAGFLHGPELSPCPSPYQRAQLRREVQQPGCGPSEAHGPSSPSPLAPSHSLSDLLFIPRRPRCPLSRCSSHQSSLGGSVRGASTKTSHKDWQQARKQQQQQPQQHVRPRHSHEKHTAQEQPHHLNLPIGSQQRQPSPVQPSRQHSPVRHQSLADGKQDAINSQGPGSAAGNPFLLLQGLGRILGLLQQSASSTTSPSLQLDSGRLQEVERAIHTLATWNLEAWWSPEEWERIGQGDAAARPGKKPPFLKSSQLCHLLHATGRLLRSTSRRVPEHQLRPLTQLLDLLVRKVHAPSGLPCLARIPVTLPATDASGLMMGDLSGGTPQPPQPPPRVSSSAPTSTSFSLSTLPTPIIASAPTPINHCIPPRPAASHQPQHPQSSRRPPSPFGSTHSQAHAQQPSPSLFSPPPHPTPLSLDTADAAIPAPEYLIQPSDPQGAHTTAHAQLHMHSLGASDPHRAHIIAHAQLHTRSLGKALQGLAMVPKQMRPLPVCPSLATWLEASIPWVSHARALDLAALYVAGVGPLTARAAQELIDKVHPWLVNLTDQARHLPPDATQHKIWADRTIPPVDPTGSSQLSSGLTSCLLPLDAPTALPRGDNKQHDRHQPSHATEPQEASTPSPLGCLVHAARLLSTNSQSNQVLCRMERLALELAACLPSCLNTQEVCILLEHGLRSHPSNHYLHQSMLSEVRTRLP